MIDSAHDPPPSPEVLAGELAVVARNGAHSSHELVDNVPTLASLRIVRSLATSDEPREHVLRMAEVLNQAVDRLGESRLQEAARILLGLDPDAGGNLTARRRRAAGALYGAYARNERTFRGTDQPELLLRVADQLYLMEGEHGHAGPASSGSDARASAIVADGERRYVVGTSAPTPVSPGKTSLQRRRRRLVLIGSASAIAVVATLVVAVEAASRGRGRSPAPHSVLSESFSSRNRGWTDDAVFRYEDETYIGLLAPGEPDGRASRAPVATNDIPPDLRVSVEGTKISQGPGGSFGVFCRDTGGLRYGARIDPESQSFTIYKVETAGQRGTSVVPRGVSDSIRQSGTNIVALECTGDPAGQKPVVLALFVNNERVGGHVDPIGYATGSAGVEVASGSGGVEVRFDNLVLSRA